jgi:NAD(P)-dependent dehydrogenase (short-subunit alcohol dehydrogenase family)
LNEFRGRVAVVTGAASGIGKALAERFAVEGMNLVLADIDAERLHATTNAMRESGAVVIAVPTDVSRCDDVEALADQALAEFGGIHILCNNAGVGGETTWMWEQTVETWQWAMGVNLWGVIHGIRAFMPIMLHQGTEGHIVNTASLAGLMSLPFFSVYDATKHAVVTLSESLHFELAMQQAKVRVSVLCPGGVQTPIMDFDRYRPSALRNQGFVRQAEPQAWYDAWCKMLATGTAPAEIARAVLDAIRDEQFYIIPHPELLPLVRERMETILAQRNPVLSLAKEVEMLIEEARQALATTKTQ